MKYLDISITNPCNENWDSMTEAEKGRFCQKCQKEVVDFTQMTDNQIISFFQEHQNKNVCGRFYPYQIEVPLALEVPKSKPNFLKAAALAIGVAGSSMLTAQTQSPVPVSHISAQQPKKQQKSDKKDDPLSNTRVLRIKNEGKAEKFIMTFVEWGIKIVCDSTIDFIEIPIPKNTKFREITIKVNIKDRTQHLNLNISEGLNFTLIGKKVPIPVMGKPQMEQVMNNGRLTTISKHSNREKYMLYQISIVNDKK